MSWENQNYNEYGQYPDYSQQYPQYPQQGQQQQQQGRGSPYLGAGGGAPPSPYYPGPGGGAASPYGGGDQQQQWAGWAGQGGAHNPGYGHNPAQAPGPPPGPGQAPTVGKLSVLSNFHYKYFSLVEHRVAAAPGPHGDQHGHELRGGHHEAEAAGGAGDDGEICLSGTVKSKFSNV